MAFRYLSRSISIDSKSFEKYPAHMPASDVVLSDGRPGGVLIPSVYQKFILQRKDELATDIFRFVFELPTKFSTLGLPIGQHVTIKGQCGDHTVSRSYTPVR